MRMIPVPTRLFWGSTLRLYYLLKLLAINDLQNYLISILVALRNIIYCLFHANTEYGI